MSQVLGGSRSFRALARLHRLSVATLALLSLLVAGAFVTTLTLTERHRQDELAQVTNEMRTSVGSLTAQMRNTMRTLGAAVDADGSAQGFSTATQPLVASGSVAFAALLDTTSSPPRALHVTGANGVAGSSLPPIASDAVKSLTIDQPFRTTPVMSGSSGQRHLGILQGAPVTPTGTALYLEVPLRSFEPAATQQIFGPSQRVHAALYAGDAHAQSLLYATTEGLPLSGRVVELPVQVGPESWTLVVAEREPLLDPFATALPWALLLGGIAVAILATSVIEVVQRRHRDALAVASEHARETMAVLSAAGEAFVAIDADSIIRRWNQEAVGLFGWTEEEVIGRQLVETIIPPEYRQAHLDGLARYVETGEGRIINRRVELEAITKSGQRLPVEVSVWRAQHDEHAVFNAILHDITERKATAVELEQAHQRALEASRLKSEFLANMSHEIRTPMNGVIGMTSLLMRTRLDPEQREYAETVRNSAEALLTVINDILDFSKIEAGKLRLEYAEFEVLSVIEDVASVLADRAQQKHLELVTNLDPEVPLVVNGDAGRLRQVLLNLVSNAVKFTDDGEVAITCTLDHHESGYAYIRFSVTDTGIGIPEFSLPNLFDSFTQADMSTTRQYEGTGLGLAIARQLTELMGGQIGVESTVGEGSTFWFCVPFEECDPSHLKRSFSTTSLQDVKVLVVDDNATNRTFLSKTLESWGMVPTAVTCAEEALHVLASRDSEEPYKLALLDLHMPNVDGLELAKIIHQTYHDSLGFPRIGLLTSSGDQISPEQLGGSGVAFSLSKPVRHVLLHDRIADSFGSREMAAHGSTDMPAHTPGPLLPVLVVEDNPVNQQVAQKLLESLGCTVDLAINGAEAVEAVLQGQYSMVFMDCQMPVLDGYAATREIRRREGPQHIPIIAMTASAMRGDRERALDAGMDDYIAKPVRPDELAELIQRWSSLQASDEINLDTLESVRLGTGPDQLAEILRRFQDSARQDMASIEAAWQLKDVTAVMSLSHKLRGAAGTLGLDQLAGCCLTLEEAGQQDPTALPEHLESLRHHLDAALQALHQLMPR